MKPVIKYRGGKWTEIKQFQSHIPDHFATYIEPFFGGGAVFFHLEPARAIINDVNGKLVAFYRDIKGNYPEMRRQLDELQLQYERNQQEYEQLKAAAAPEEYVENKNEALYYQLRHYFNEPHPDWLSSVIYFFINKTAYSGMIRHNRKGGYNVPFGRYKNLNTKRITEHHHELFKRTEIYNCDYGAVFKLAQADDFMFLDPPYDTIFNDYGNLAAAEGFNETEHERLARAYKKLTCKALMVISRTPLTYELYKEYTVAQYDKTYAVNIRNRFKSEVQHLIVRNY